MSPTVHTHNRKSKHFHNTLQLQYLGFGLGASPRFLQQNLLWVSSWTKHSFIYITPSKLSPMLSLAHSNLVTLFASRISWQYVLLLYVQPKPSRQWRVVFLHTQNPFDSSSLCKSSEVASSFSHILSSTMLFISGVIFFRSSWSWGSVNDSSSSVFLYDVGYALSNVCIVLLQ